MLTTFARIAKILKGLVEPRNWVEEAFAESGGGSGDNVEVVHFTMIDGNIQADKTFSEVRDAHQSGKIVFAIIGGITARVQNLSDDSIEFSAYSFNPGSPGNITFALIVYVSDGSISTDTGSIILNS